MSIDPFDSEGLRKNLRQRAVRGGMVTLLAQGFLFGIQFTGSVLMARLLNPDDFGLVGMVVAVVGFLEIFKDLGLSAATVQEPHITRPQVNVLFWLNTLAGVIMSLITLALAPLLAWFYGRPELIGITMALSMGFVISGLAAQHKALLRRSLQFGQIARIDISTALLGLVSGLVAANIGMGYWSIVIQQMARAGVSGVGLWISTSWRPSRYRWDPSVKPMLRFGGFFALNSTMNYASRNIDNIAIGWMWGAGALGEYSRAYSLLTMPLSQISTPIAHVATPALSRLRDEPRSLRTNFLAMMRSVGFLLVPAIAALMACSDSVILILLGEKWARVAIIYRWLGFAALAEPMITTCSILFLSQGRSKELAKANFINSIISMVSILCALPWGPVAVAASYSSVGLIVRAPITFYFTAKLQIVTKGDLYRTVVPQLLQGGLIFGVGFYALKNLAIQNPLHQIALASLIGVIIFLLNLCISHRQRTAAQWLILMYLSYRNRTNTGKAPGRED